MKRTVVLGIAEGKEDVLIWSGIDRRQAVKEAQKAQQNQDYEFILTYNIHSQRLRVRKPMQIVDNSKKVIQEEIQVKEQTAQPEQPQVKPEKPAPKKRGRKPKQEISIRE